MTACLELNNCFDCFCMVPGINAWTDMEVGVAAEDGPGVVAEDIWVSGVETGLVMMLVVEATIFDDLDDLLGTHSSYFSGCLRY